MFGEIMPIHFFDPTRFAVEIIYTLLIVVLCFLVYFRTKNIFDLTKHRGIQYFRNAFLFFGLAYSARLLIHLIMIGRIAFDFCLRTNHNPAQSTTNTDPYASASENK